jgi:ketose-bisphosphate aldolase
MKNTLKIEIERRLKSRKPIIAINVESIDQIIVLQKIAQELNQIIIVQFSARNINWFFDFYKDNLFFFNHKNLFFHLDHCDDFKIIQKCIAFGFHSVMYDGSNTSIENNIANTVNLYQLAHRNSVLLEVEVGPIKGVEDGYGSEEGGEFKLNEALKMYKEANFDMLALTIGNAHGEYSTVDNINTLLLKDFQDILPEYIPLVLHGGTGLSSKILKECVAYGCIKVNFSTEFKKSFSLLKKRCNTHHEFLNELKIDYYERIAKFYKLWF